MGIVLFRMFAICVEVIILMAAVYALLLALMLAALDLGLGQKYKGFIGRVLLIIGGLALIFFVGHLVAFYPRLPH